MPTDLCLIRHQDAAALAAAFPSSKHQPCNWRRLDYLAHGNARQQQLRLFLQSTQAAIWRPLQQQCCDLALVSSHTIGLDLATSDVDIIGQHPAPYRLARYWAKQGWHYHAKRGGQMVIRSPHSAPYCFAIELFISPQPLTQLNSWRHLSVMAALLEGRGDDFYHAICLLRHRYGLKAEAAICQLLGLVGNPYQLLLQYPIAALLTRSYQPHNALSSHLAL